MSKVDHFELRVSGPGDQIVLIPYEGAERALPMGKINQLLEGEGVTKLQRRANKVQAPLVELKHAVQPLKHYEGRFVCPVLLPQENLSLCLVAFSESGKELWQRNFFNIDLFPGAQFMYDAGVDGITAPHGVGFFTAANDNLRAGASLKPGGPPTDDISLRLSYAASPKLLKGKHQGPYNFVQGRFIYLTELQIRAKAVLME